MKNFLLITTLMLLPPMANADLRIFACEPEWAALSRELGREHVVADSATTALQDPHYIQARPSLIARMRRADLVICSGAELEIGWLPVLRQKANNPRVARGTPGYLEASGFVVRLEATGDVDRGKGDAHPQGNPHIQTDPRNIAIIAEVLAERMAVLDPDNAATYQAGYVDFSRRWTQAITTWEVKAQALKGKRAITHHKSWVYLERWLEIEEVANLEPIPGIPPTASHLSQLVSRFKDGGADFIIRSSYQDAKPSEWLAQRSGIPDVMLPITLGGSDEATDLFGLFDDIINRLLGTTSK